MRQKYKRKPYVHQEWPKMFYHSVTAAYIICQDESEVPRDFVNNINDCKKKLGPTEEPVRYTGPLTYSDDEKPKASKKSKAAKKPKAEEPVVEEVVEAVEAETPTLKGLKLTREQAMEMLDEEKVQYKKNASNDTVAALVAGLLEDE